MICKPIGKPSDEKPAGTETAGFQQRLASIVKGVDIAGTLVSTPPITDGGGPSAANAGTAVVGHNTTSTSSKMRAQSYSSCSRALIDRAYFRNVVLSVCSSDCRTYMVKSSARAGHMSSSMLSHNEMAPVVSHARTGSVSTIGSSSSTSPAADASERADASVISATSGSTMANPRSSDQRARNPRTSVDSSASS